MSTPTVSVIIPTYGGADYVGEAIQSVLEQSFTDFELIVVDDVSPDQTASVVAQFNDPRLLYLVHEKNLGAVAARKTGVDHSQGEIIAFLDQDDLFHRNKLQAHVDYLDRRPEVGVTYNARFEYELETQSIRAIWQPPEEVSLFQLVAGFPFSPSDTVMRREFALCEEIWDQSYVIPGEEMIFNGAEMILGGRLALRGCLFGNVRQVLNYRRFHPRRRYRNIPGRCKAELNCQRLILEDPRCPADVQQQADKAYLNTYMIWAYYAFAQDDTEDGRRFVSESARLKPAILQGSPASLVEFLAVNCADDGSVDFETQLIKIVAQLSPEIDVPAADVKQVLAQGYLMKGMLAVLWDRPVDARKFIARAGELGASLDETVVQNLTHQLLGYQSEYGEAAAREKVTAIQAAISQIGLKQEAQHLLGSFLVNQAFAAYHDGRLGRVPRQVLRAISADPKYLLNRGVWSILFRSSAAAGMGKAVR